MRIRRATDPVESTVLRQRLAKVLLYGGLGNFPGPLFHYDPLLLDLARCGHVKGRQPAGCLPSITQVGPDDPYLRGATAIR